MGNDTIGIESLMMQYNGELTKEEKSLQKQKVMASGEWGRGNIEVWAWEVQTIMYKISYKDILYNTGNTANIL